MTNWTHGYFADSGYTFGYFGETSPTALAWAALNQGHKAPKSGFRYVDAGCGQGLNLILHAASHPESEFVGIDFLPEHIAHANSLAAMCGLKNIQFYEADFIDLASDPLSLGQFDYAVCHGIATWISPNVRGALHKYLGKALKPGGVLYTSYNTMPGWLSALPFQHLVLLEQKSKNGEAALRAATNYFTELEQVSSALFKAYPQLNKRLEIMKNQEPAYLLQEYNNQSWEPLFVTQMIEELEKVKLSYLGTSSLLEAFDNSYSTELLKLLNKESRIEIREQIRDYAINQQFRRDLYVKGKKNLWNKELMSELESFKIFSNPLVSRPPNGEDYTFEAGAIKLKGSRRAYDAIMDIIENNKNGSTIAEILKIQKKENNRSLVVAISNLIVARLVILKMDNENVSTKKCNEAIISCVANGASYRYLSIPGASTACQLPDVEMFILHNIIGGIQLDELAKSTFDLMSSLGRSVVKNGKAVEDQDEALKLISVHIENMKIKRLNFYRNMGVI